MRSTLRLVVGSAVIISFGSAADAHFTMLFVQPPAAKRGEPVSVIYQWGHPFEHQLFNTPAAKSLKILAPDGTPYSRTNLLEQFFVGGAEGKQVAAFRARYTPEQRGDYVFVLQTAPIWMEEEKEFYEDTAKVVLHVQAQKGWDGSTGQGFEMTPLTRPYGLLPGAVFQAQAQMNGKPVPGALVEIERYNATPPKELPREEHITRTAKTDPSGVVTTSFPEPGWWCVAAQRDGGMKERDGKPYPVRERAIFWVHVDAAAKK